MLVRDTAWKTGPAAKSAAQIAREKVFGAGMGVGGFEEMCGYGRLVREARGCAGGCHNTHPCEDQKHPPPNIF